MNLNRIILAGHLTRDCELRYASSGLAVCTFGLAVNTRSGQGEERKEEVLFIDVTVFGRQAETTSQYLAKGHQCLIEGRLQFRTWETQDGQKRSKHAVIGERVQFMNKTQAEREEGQQEASHYTVSERGTTRRAAAPSERYAGMEDDDSDIPF